MGFPFTMGPAARPGMTRVSPFCIFGFEMFECSIKSKKSKTIITECIII